MGFIVIEGNATSDATLREFTSNRTGNTVPISNATVAVNDRRFDQESGEWVDTGVTYYEVTVTGEQAIHFAASAIKGARMIIAGQPYAEDYRDSDGNPRSRRRISVEHHGLSTRYTPAVVPSTRR